MPLLIYCKDIMNLLILLLSLSISTGILAQDEGANTSTDVEPIYLLDDIRAIVVTADSTELVTQSDLDRPNFFGRMPTLDEEIEERLIYQNAQKYHISITDEQIDRQIANVMQRNNLTLDKLKEVCAEYGMTYQDLRDKLARIYAVNTMREHEIEGKLIINRSDIVDYYEEHPEYTDVVYELQNALVPYSEDREVQKEALLARITAGDEMRDLGWSIVFSVQDSAISEAKSFICTMQVGDIAISDAKSNGFELYRLVNKQEATVRSLEERYGEIDAHLRHPLRETLMEEYRKKLFEAATIVYLD